MGEQADWQATGDRIDALIAASAAGGVAARERSEELVRLVVDLYGAGLERIFDLLHEHGRLTDEALAALAGDDLVASLLLVHGLHPYNVDTRVAQALDRIRPLLERHGGEVELIEITGDGVARLRLAGNCRSTADTLAEALTDAVEAAAPEITAVEVRPPEAEPLIPVRSLFSRLGRVAS